MENETAFIVAAAGDPEDWVASFRKSADFPARAWARRMAALYNQRLPEGASRPGESAPPSGTYHPESTRDGQ